MSQFRRLGAAAVVAALAGCGSTGSSPAGIATATATPTSHLTVFAAASLTEAFTAAERTLEQRGAAVTAKYSFAGSQQLVSNVIDGAPADVIATANTSTMQKLVSAGLVGPPQVFARNRLEIVVARGNPKRIAGLASLSRGDVTVVLADPSAPVGDFARQALAKAGVSVTPKSLELNVKSALQKVSSGDADAAIVYSTDVAAAGATVDGVLIPDSQNIIATYPIAVLRSSQQPAAAQAFVTEAVAGEIQRVLQARGFLPPA